MLRWKHWRSKEARLTCLLGGLELANQASMEFATSRQFSMRLPENALHVLRSVGTIYPSSIIASGPRALPLDGGLKPMFFNRSLISLP